MKQQKNLRRQQVRMPPVWKNPLQFLRKNYGYCGMKKDIAKEMGMHTHSIAIIEQDITIMKHLILIDKYAEKLNIPFPRICVMILRYYQFNFKKMNKLPYTSRQNKREYAQEVSERHRSFESIISW